MLFAAFIMAARDGFQKRVLGDIDAYELGFFSGIIGSILLLPYGVMYFPTGVSLLSGVLLILLGIFTVGSIWMFLVALDLGEMSVVTPLRRISPVFVALLEPFFLALSFNPLVIFGALLCGLGAFITAVETENLFDPLKDLMKFTAVLAIGVAVLKAFGSIVTVYLVEEMSVLFLSFYSVLTMAVGFGLITYRNNGGYNYQKIKDIEVFSVGILAVVGTVLITYAYSLATATQVVTVKQTTILFSIIIAGYYFEEESLKRKTVGSLLIIAAVILVSIY